MTTINDVATRAGVSSTTVSHVYSGKRPVSPATRRTVLDAADALGYVPDPKARGLRTGQTMAIGIVLPQLSMGFEANEFPGVWIPLLEGLSAGAAARGYTFLVLGVEALSQSALTVAKKPFDGVVVAGPSERDDLVERLAEFGIPTVTVGRSGSDAPLPWIDTAEAAGIRSLLAHLAERGYVRPVLLSTGAKLPYVSEVEDEFRRHVAASGSTPTIIHMDQAGRGGIRRVAEELVTGEHGDFDAVVGLTNALVMPVLATALRHGLPVPDQIGFGGIGDIFLSEPGPLPLTSVRFDYRAMGITAVEMLIDSLAGGSVSNQWSNGELIVRASTTRDEAAR